MKINPQIFRGYDIRGLVDEELNEEVLYTIGQAYSTFLYKRRIQDCVIGMDVRESSQKYKDAFVKGLLESGINVIDIGLTLVQILYFAQYRFLSKGGAMITASHNPAEYNGLKLAVGFSDTMITKEIQEVRETAISGNFKGWGNLGKYEKIDVYEDYRRDLIRKVPEKKFDFKVVVDGLNATAGAFLPQIFRDFGCEVVEQNTKLDGSFPLGTPDPTERKFQENLAKKVLEVEADIGFSFDSDGDRVGIVDEKGNVIWNDLLVALFAKDVLEFLPRSPIVFNTLCSKATLETINAYGGKPIMWLTGHSFIEEKVAVERAPFGGELSGHFFFKDNYYGFDDEAYSSLRLLSYLKRTGQSLSQAISSLPKYFSSPEIKLGLADEIKFKLIDEEIAKDAKEVFPEADFVTIDGIRVDTREEMFVIRASQNGPYITIKFEGKTQKQYDELKIKIREILKKYKQIDWSRGVNTDAFD